VAMLLGSSLVQPCGSKIRHENEKDASAILVRILQTRRLTIRGRDGVVTRSVGVRMLRSAFAFSGVVSQRFKAVRTAVDHES
jgi:hypothetical protein